MNILKWVLYFLAALIIVYTVDFFLRKKNSKLFKILSIIIKLILAVACAFLPLGGPIFLRPIQELLVALYVVILCDAVCDFIYLFIKRKHFLCKTLISFVLSLIFFLYGTINMNTTVKTEYTIYSDKLTNDYSFAYISDVHTGDSLTKEARYNLVCKLKELDVDFIVLGGDITDDYTTVDEMKEFYSYFKDFTIPVYFTYGNHDTQDNETFHSKDSYEVQELLDTIELNGIIILNDTKGIVEVGDDFDIFGRDDKTINKNRLDNDSFDIDENKFTVCFDHQPCDLKGESLPDCDLQLSGHTHAGQFTPLGTIYKLVEPTYGEYNYGDKTLIVSSGAAAWRVPFRTSNHSEYVVVNLKAR